MPKEPKQVTLEDVRILFRNFEGKKGPYNQEGSRNFHVVLPDDIAEEMIEQGWNVKTLESREEGEPDLYHVEVTVNFTGRPPRIVMISSRGRTTFYERDVKMLDWADIKIADMILNPYQWEVNEKSGVKAYLKSLFVTINEDELELKYAEVEDEGDLDG